MCTDGLPPAAAKRPEAGEAVLPPWDGKALLLVDLDAFFASVEQLDHPGWRGKPVIVGGSAEDRGVVSTASYEARAYGVRSAMASSVARSLCPHAIWTQGSYDRYREMSRQVMAILLDETPLVQQVSIDEAFADVTPTKTNREHPVLVARRIQQRVEQLGISCSIGIGTSKAVAKIASEEGKPRGLTAIYPGTEADFLAPMPVKALSGIGDASARALASRGIHTLGDLANAGDGVLKRLLGKNGAVMKRRAQGLGDADIQQDEPAKSVSNELSFAKDLSERGDIEAAMATMAGNVGRRLRADGLRGSTLTLKLRLGDRSAHTVQRKLQRPSDDDIAWRPLLREMLDDLWFEGLKVRLVGVGMSDFGDDAAAQPTLFDALEGKGRDGGGRTGEGRRDLLVAADSVRERFGEAAVRFGSEIRTMEGPNYRSGLGKGPVPGSQRPD